MDLVKTRDMGGTVLSGHALPVAKTGFWACDWTPDDVGERPLTSCFLKIGPSSILENSIAGSLEPSTLRYVLGRRN